MTTPEPSALRGLIGQAFALVAKANAVGESSDSAWVAAGEAIDAFEAAVRADERAIRAEEEARPTSATLMEASDDYARRYDVGAPGFAASIQLAFIRGAEWLEAREGEVRDAQAMVREFHEAFGLPIGDSPQLLDGDRTGLRYELIREELGELADAQNGTDLVPIADALADLAYVVYGAAVEYGIDLNAVVAEVHRSNMSKLDADGKPVLREDGKVLKGPHYEPPNIARALGLAGEGKDAG